MALALNVFQTVTYVAPTNPVGIYTAPVGYTKTALLWNQGYTFWGTYYDMDGSPQANGTMDAGGHSLILENLIILRYILNFLFVKGL